MAVFSRVFLLLIFLWGNNDFRTFGGLSVISVINAFAHRCASTAAHVDRRGGALGAREKTARLLCGSWFGCRTGRARVVRADASQASDRCVPTIWIAPDANVRYRKQYRRKYDPSRGPREGAPRKQQRLLFTHICYMFLCLLTQTESFLHMPRCCHPLTTSQS